MSQRRRQYAVNLFAFLLLGLALGTDARAAAFPELIDTLQNVGPKGAGNAQAQAAWKELVSEADPEQLPSLMAALDHASPLAANWIRSAVDTVASQALAKEKLPTKDLEAFALDTEHTPRARRLAYEWLVKADPTAEERLIPGMLNDPGNEFRRDAVARLVKQAEAAEGDTQTELYTQAFQAARDLDQVKDLKEILEKRGIEVSLPRHFGFIMDWKLVGPFDNSNESGFLVAYPPEIELNLGATYNGKDGKEISWHEHTTTDPYGMVDLNTAIGKHMGAVGYGYTEFFAEEPQEVEFRLGSICACRIWLNGELIDSHEKYHTGSSMDQYISTGKLKAGKNVILIKCCQNEQTQSWAQEWEYQLRICDPSGTAILSTKRPAEKAPEAE